MTQTYEKGSILLRPASFYNDTKLSKAQRDDELIKKRYADPKNATLSYIDKKSGDKKVIKDIISMSPSVASPTDYYIYCLTHNFDLRYFEDYKADACLVIHDHVAFSKKIYTAMKKALPSWGPSPMPNPIAYFDPFEDKEPVVMITKDLKYYYQSELRYIALPPFPNVMMNLKELEITLENPAECMDLVTLDAK